MTATDVLIVGAGPTGMTMALELAMQRVPFRLVEKEAVRSDKSRALVIHSRTMELLNRHGNVAKGLDAQGARLTGATVWVNQRKAGTIDTVSSVDESGVVDTQFPGLCLISQAETEMFLEKALLEKGVDVERPVTVKEIKQDGDGVSVVLAKADGSEETVRCKYVVGCDGSHSIVRHSADMTFEGGAYPQDFILADTHIECDVRLLNGANLIFGNGMAMLLPLKDGIVRIVASRPGQAVDRDPTLEDFQEFMSKMLPGDLKIHDPVWLTRFHLHHRGVNKYRDGRLFVAGDAAHIHSPVGGQGMNTGIQDAVNLAWKLARVLRGDKPDAFLDSYHEERWPVGQHLLARTDTMFSFMATVNPIIRFLRNFAVPWLVPLVERSPQRRASMSRFMSQLGIKYRRSPIVSTASGFEGPVRGGHRAPDGKVRTIEGEETWLSELLKGPSHHLLLFSGRGNESEEQQALEAAGSKFSGASRDGADVHVICHTDPEGPNGILDVDGALHRRYGFSKSGYVYVRPDGYLEHVGYLSDMP